MRIAEIAPLTIAVPPRDYGGTERVIANLTDALVRLGHDVTLFASGDSTTLAKLVSPVEHALVREPGADALAYHLALLTEVYRRAETFDVIHNHLGYVALPFTTASATPTVTTLHGRMDIPGQDLMRALYGGARFVSISLSQRRAQPSLNYVANVYHGVDVRSFPFREQPGDYLAFVGRISPEKGPEHAIEIAKRAGIPLKIAAKVDPVDQKYFDHNIKHLLDHPLVEFLGPLAEEPKRALMANALALLAPIMWSEPFGMVFAEAMACGTPVLTRPCGSAPEVIEENITGFLRGTDDELADAVREVGQFPRQRIREQALRRFDVRRMAIDYVNVFRQVLGESEAFGAEAHAAVER